MDRILKLLGLTFCLLALQSNAYVTDEEFKRALLTLRELEEESENQRSVGECKEYGDDCTGIINCCSTLQCFWKDGYTLRKEGWSHDLPTVVNGLKPAGDGGIRCLEGLDEMTDGMLQKGQCVRCVREGQKCQRDSQCCGSPKALQCDKGNALWVDGTCEVYRSSGSCYRDGQCVKGCEKTWYQTHGSCQ